MEGVAGVGTERSVQGARTSGLRRNRNWHALWFGQAVSVVGDQVFDITIVLWISTVIAKGQSWAPAAVGAVLITAVVPVLVIGPLAGVFTDRWDNRRTMLAMDGARVLFTLVLLVVPAAGDGLSLAARLAVIYTVVALNSVAAQFFNPARFTLISVTVPTEDRAQAASLTQATTSFAAVVGPPLAAPLLFTVGVQWALIVNAASFAVSFLSVRRVRAEVGADATNAAPSGNFRSDFRVGFTAFLGNPVMVTICIATSVAMLGVGALNALDVFFVTDNLHADATWLGPLGSAFGLGSIAGALATGYVARRIGSRRVFWLGLAVAGVLMLGYSRATALPWAIVLLFLAGLPISALNSVIGPIVMEATPREVLGRVISVLNPIIQLSAVVAMALSSTLASTVLLHFHATVLGVRLGRIDLIFGIAALLMIVAGLVAFRFLEPADQRATGPDRGQPTAEAATSTQSSPEPPL